ncbi:Wadjet anti-phage system protein JetD domain-containing protein [Paenibacillus tepidiphilus]|uniref:Wadjet anti-phage system protein JetD domain-containing protein n=1 Tax=Paenibacillus tepidiphilus TaxID=2608683 RepID=UPI00123BD11F|nr:Wadjet anti-phage system protein JetD domain-containing protein [Paenibacillus tepidiphilus]
MLRMMDQEMLRFDYYNNHPGEQTAEKWLYITRVYEFLRTAEQREWVTQEERSLELFGREKWLAGSEGRAFLSRLGLTLDSIKAEHTSEPFIFYRVPETPVYSILIVENLSIYHSARRLLGQGLPICGYRPEMLIYGEGWKIVRSLAHLEELCLGAGIDILYAGDMDKTGYDIYGKLKLSYSGLNLLLALSLYEEMMKYPEHAYPYDDHKQQDCSPKHLEIVYGEFSVNADLTAYVKRLLEEGRRIPQEVLNYEVMARLAKA